MGKPARKDFTIKANGYWTQVWQVTSNGAPVDITGYSFELEAKKNKGNFQNALLTLTVGNGIEIEDAVNGQIRLEIPPQPSISQAQTFFYDVIAIKDGKPYVWLEGQLTFEPGVSYLNVG